MNSKEAPHPHKRATQADIAARVGISRATVSAALSESRFVSPELKAQILQAAEALHYVPDILARSMKTNRTMTIGLVLPNILSPVWATISRGVADVARSAGFSTLMYDTDEQCDVMQTALRNLRERRVDGIVLAPCGEPTAAALAQFIAETAMPIALIDREIVELSLDTVVSDNASGTYQATKHLLDAGRQRIGLVNLPLAISTGRDRLKGYQRALKEHGRPVADALIAVGGRGIEEGYRQADRLLSLSTDRRPDALLVSSHLMTLGALRALRDRALRIPEDVAVIGFDDTAWASLIDPPLTVVNQQAYEIGSQGARLLLARLTSGATDGAPRRIVLPTELICRRSCCAGHPTASQ
jgi:DNA-binding LacI/PurR family transcriptional regulator